MFCQLASRMTDSSRMTVFSASSFSLFLGFHFMRQKRSIKYVSSPSLRNNPQQLFLHCFRYIHNIISPEHFLEQLYHRDIKLFPTCFFQWRFTFILRATGMLSHHTDFFYGIFNMVLDSCLPLPYPKGCCYPQNLIVFQTLK